MAENVNISQVHNKNTASKLNYGVGSSSELVYLQLCSVRDLLVDHVLLTPRIPKVLGQVAFHGASSGVDFASNNEFLVVLSEKSNFQVLDFSLVHHQVD